MPNGWSCIQRMDSAKQNAGCFPWRSDKGLAGRTQTILRVWLLGLRLWVFPCCEYSTLEVLSNLIFNDMRSHYSWKQTDSRLPVLLGQVEATHVIDVIDCETETGILGMNQSFYSQLPNYCHRTRTIAMPNGWSCIQRMDSAKQNAGCFPWRSDKGLAGRTRTLWSCFAFLLKCSATHES